VKREAPTNTKMRKLCHFLDIHLYEAVGILELLWHLCAREAPRGDIGKISNLEIAVFLEYRGDADRLIAALIRAGWLDEDPVYRLVVHDWSEHADQAVRRRLDRFRQTFIVSSQKAHVSSHSETEARLDMAGQNDHVTRHGWPKRQNVQTNGEINSSARAREPEPDKAATESAAYEKKKPQTQPRKEMRDQIDAARQP